jgi:hypothetical protein
MFEIATMRRQDPYNTMLFGEYIHIICMHIYIWVNRTLWSTCLTICMEYRNNSTRFKHMFIEPFIHAFIN